VPATEYLTTPELDELLTGDLLDRATESQKQRALERASDAADSYLRAAGYQLPVANPGSDLRARVADMSRYHLAVVLRLLPEPANSSALWIDYKSATDWFQRVANGEIALDLPLVSGATSAGRASISTTVARRWGRA